MQAGDMGSSQQGVAEEKVSRETSKLGVSLARHSDSGALQDVEFSSVRLRPHTPSVIDI